MGNNAIKFYSNRVKTGFLGIILLGTIYMFYTKLLQDTHLMTKFAVIFMWVIVAVAFIAGIAYLIKTFDPRPVVEITPEGIVIRTFLFLEDFVPWNEVIGVKQEEYKNQVTNPHIRAKVTTYFLRVYRDKQRSLAINLSLLNTRGNEFHETLAKYLA